MLNRKPLIRRFASATRDFRNKLANRIEGKVEIDISPEDVADIFFQRDLTDEDQQRLAHTNAALDKHPQWKAELADLIRFDFWNASINQTEGRKNLIGQGHLSEITTPEARAQFELAAMGMNSLSTVRFMGKYHQVAGVFSPHPSNEKDMQRQREDFIAILRRFKEEAPEHFKLRVFKSTLKNKTSPFVEI